MDISIETIIFTCKYNRALKGINPAFASSINFQRSCFSFPRKFNYLSIPMQFSSFYILRTAKLILHICKILR